MSDLLPYIVVGITSGSLYGLAGLGLTLTYKTSGVFNFGHGAVAAAGCFAFYVLHVEHGAPWPIALLVSVAGVGLVAGVLVERMSRQLAIAGPTTAIVGTVGLLLTIQGALYLVFGFTTRQFDSFVGGTAFRVEGVDVGWQQVLAVGVAAVAAGALFAFFSLTRLGTATRAVVDDPDLLDLTGASPARVRSTAWVIGCSFAALSGILIAPFQGLDVALLTLLVVQAFGAVAIGRFASLPGTYLGGVALGIVASLLTKFLASQPSLSGLPSSLPFIALLVGLVAFPPRSVARRTGATDHLVSVATSTRQLPRWVLASGALAGGVALLLVPSLVGARVAVYTRGLTFVVLFASLALLVRTSGQISLCHASFAAFGASAFSHLATGAGLPWGLALVLAGLAVVPMGALVALPAIRLSGVYLALATFGFAILMERVLYGSGLMFGALGYRAAPRPEFARTETGLYFVTLAVAVAACALVVLVVRSRLGRLLRGLAESPTALTTNGLGVSVTRLLVFCISAFFAGISGALVASALGNVSGRGFGSFDSLFFLAVVLISGSGLLSSSIKAAVAVAVLPAYLPSWFLEHQPLIFGLSAMTVVALPGLRVRSARAVERTGTGPMAERWRGMQASRGSRRNQATTR